MKWKSDFNDFKVSFSISNSEGILTRGLDSKASLPHCTERLGYVHLCCPWDGDNCPLHSGGLIEIALSDKPSRFRCGHSRTFSLSYLSL